MVQMGGGSGSGDGITWQVDTMRSAVGLNQVLAWGNPVDGGGEGISGFGCV